MFSQHCQTARYESLHASGLLAGNRVLIAGDIVGTDLPVAVVPKPEPFVDLTQLRARRFAVETQIRSSKRRSPGDGPLQEFGRSLPPGILASHGHTMHKGRFIRRHIRPIKLILELITQCSYRQAIMLRKKVEAPTNVIENLFGQKFVESPKLVAQLFQPGGGLREDFGYGFHIGAFRLSDGRFHLVPSWQAWDSLRVFFESFNRPIRLPGAETHPPHLP